MTERRQERSRRWSLSVEVWLLVIVLIVIGYAAARFQWTRAIDDLLYDQLQHLVAPAIPGDVVVLAIDERTLEELGRWPWPRTRLAAVLTRLAQTAPRAVAIDIVLADPALEDPAGDAVLARAVAGLPNVVLPVFIDSLEMGGQAIEVLPMPALAELATLGHVHIEFDVDGIARGIYLFQGVGDAHWPHFSLALANRLDEADQVAPPADGFDIRRVRREYRRVPIRGSSGSVANVSVLEMLENPRVAELLRDKTIFLGVVATAADDAVLTPGVSAERPMSGVELNAHIYSAIRTDSLITPLAWSWGLALTLAFCSLAPILLPRLDPRWSLAVTLALALLPLAMTLVLLQTAVWFAPLTAVFVTLLAYPLWSWRRLDYAFRYLVSDLGELEREANQMPVATERRDLAQCLKFLVELYRLDGWRIGPADGSHSDPPVPECGHWVMRDGGAWLRLSSDESGDVVRVFADDQAIRAPGLQANLQQLAADFSETRPRRRGVYEAIGALLRRLSRTSSRVRVLRRVVVDSMTRMSDGMLMVDAFGQIVLANQKAGELSGHGAPRPLIGVPMIDGLSTVTLSEGTWTSLARACLVDDNLVETDAQTASGRALLVHAASVDLGDPVGKTMIVNLVDITALRTAERQRSETLAFLSHDLRSPMVSLLALVKRRRDDVAGGNDGELLDTIESYARRNLDASDKFLQLARLQSSERVEFYDVEVTAVLDNAVEQLYFQAAEKQIRVEVDDGDEVGEGIWLRGNAELLERALINLIDNAIKYAPTGSKVVASVMQRDDQIVFEVIDQGRGIPPEEHAALFELFYRAAATRGRRERGTGLGLPFVKAVAERHGGRIEVLSSPGKGATFRLSLPADVNVKSQ